MPVGTMTCDDIIEGVNLEVRDDSPAAPKRSISQGNCGRRGHGMVKGPLGGPSEEGLTKFLPLAFFARGVGELEKALGIARSESKQVSKQVSKRVSK